MWQMAHEVELTYFYRWQQVTISKEILSTALK